MAAASSRTEAALNSLRLLRGACNDASHANGGSSSQQAGGMSGEKSAREAAELAATLAATKQALHEMVAPLPAAEAAYAAGGAGSDATDAKSARAAAALAAAAHPRAAPRGATAEEVTHALHTLQVLLNNQLKHPGAARYHRLNLHNANLQRLLQLPGAEGVLRALGFDAEEGGTASSGGTTFWAWRGGALPTEGDLELIRAQRDLLQSQLVDTCTSGGPGDTVK